MTALPRDLFEVTEHYNYLNHAATAVLPRSTQSALHDFIDGQASGGIARIVKYEHRVHEYRDRVARFIGAQPGTIAMLRSTTDAVTAVASGLRWEQGDELVMPDDEFPANAYPWLAQRQRGVNVRFIESATERVTPDALRKHMTDRTKVVAVSWVSFHDGYRCDLAGLAEVAHERGAMFCVDAIQGLGAFPLDVQALGIDALFCGTQKWLLALQGTSFLYVSPQLLERLDVATPGWRSVANIWDFLNYDQPFAPDSTRFESGTLNFIGVLALAESLGVIEQAGTERIASHVLELTDRLVDGLRSAGADVVTPRGPGISSGIVNFRMPHTDPAALGRALQDEDIVTTYRPTGIRVAPHGYNSAAEIDALVEGVRRHAPGLALR